MKTGAMSCLELCWSVGVLPRILSHILTSSKAQLIRIYDFKIHLRIVFKKKATSSHNRMSSNNICLCIIFLILLCILVSEHLHVNTPLIYHFLFYFFCCCWFFRGYFHLYIWRVLFPGGEPRTWHGLYAVYLIFLSLSLSLILGCLFTIFNVIIDHVYKGSFVISVCIGKRKILLLRPTQWRYLSVYQLHLIVQ